MEKVCVRIPADRRNDLLSYAQQLRKEAKGRHQGWDRQAVHLIADEHFGGTRGFFEAHKWPERGSDMPRQIMRRVKETYGSVQSFVEHFEKTNNNWDVPNSIK